MASVVLARTMCAVRKYIKIQHISCVNKNLQRFPLVKCPQAPTILTYRVPAVHVSSQMQSEPPVKKKKKFGPKITLIGIDENVSVTSQEDAEKLAKRRDLKLVKIIDMDTKSQRPVYKLMTGSQYFEEDLKQRKLKAERKKTEIKGEKLATISSKIDEHDLQARLKNIKKWLEKNYEARVVISNVDDNNPVNLFDRIVDYVKDQGKVSQKHKKGTEMKFKLIPLKKEQQQPAPDKEGS